MRLQDGSQRWLEIMSRILLKNMVLIAKIYLSHLLPILEDRKGYDYLAWSKR